MVLELLTGRRALAGIALAAAVALVPSLFTRDPWSPDEPRAAEVAREMVVLGNYLVPHLNGAPYSDKPPVFYWLASCFWRLGFGVNSGRMVALLATTGTLLVVYALGRRLHSPATGLLAALITLTTSLHLFIPKFGVLDTLLAFFTASSIGCVVRAFEGGPARGRWWLAAYTLAALAVLTKGPVGLMVPLVVGLAYGALRRREAVLGGWWHLAGASLLLALVAAWLVPACIAAGPEYANDILFQQTAQRLDGTSHYKPAHYYVTHAPEFFFPWTLLALLAGCWAWREARARGDRAAVLGLAWLVSVLVFFSLFTGKRERYLLPLLPAVGLLCARHAVAVMGGEAAEGRWRRALWKATFVLLGLFAVGLVGVALAPGRVAARFGADAEVLAELAAAMTPAVLVGAGVAGAAMLAACLWGLHAGPGGSGEGRRIAATVAAALIASLAIDLLGTPILNRFKSGCNLIEEAGQYISEAEEVVLYQSDFSGVYNLFTGRVGMPEVKRPEDLAARFRAPRRVAAIIKEKTLDELAAAMKFRLAARKRVGERELAVIANW